MKRAKKRANLGTRMRGKLEQHYGRRGKKSAQLFLTRSAHASTDVPLTGMLQYLNYLHCESDPSISYMDYFVPDSLQRLGVMAIAYTDSATMQIRVLRHKKNDETADLDARIEAYAAACRLEIQGPTPNYKTVDVLYLNEKLLSLPNDHIRLRNWHLLIPAASQAKFYPDEVENCKDRIALLLSREGSATISEITALGASDGSERGLFLAAAVAGAAHGEWSSDFARHPFSGKSRILKSSTDEARTIHSTTFSTPEPAQGTLDFDESLLPRPRGTTSLKEFDPLSAALNRVVYAKAEKISIRDCPSHWRDTKNWPPFDFEAVRSALQEPERTAFDKFCLGVRRYLDTNVLKKGAEAAGCAESTLLEKFRKCLRVVMGGATIWGWAALIPGARGGTYEASAAAPEARKSGGTTSSRKKDSSGKAREPAGKFRALLRNHPEILEALVDAIDAEGSPDEPAIAYQTLRQVHKSFLSACDAANLSAEEDPRTTENLCRRSVENFVHEYLDGHLGSYGRWFGEGSVVQLEVGTGKRYFQLAENPYDLVMMDAHHIDVLGTIWIETTDGPARVVVNRLWLVAIFCFISQALLGYSLSYEKQVSAETIEEAFLSATTPWKARTLVNGMRYDLGAGLPYGVVEGLEGCPIVMLRMDNFSSHYSNAIEKIRQVLGFHVNYGAVGKWFTNARLERVFRTLESMGLQVLSSTMGSNPADPHRSKNPGRAAVENGVDDQFIRDKIEKILTGENVRPSPYRSDMSPLEIIRNHLEKQRWYPRSSIKPHNGCPRIGWRFKRVVIRGHQSPGNIRRPYFELHGKHYSNPEIANGFHLIGTAIYTYTRIIDSYVEASFLNGAPIQNVVQVSGGRKASAAPMRLQTTRQLYNSKNKTYVPFETTVEAQEAELQEAAAARARTHPYAVNQAGSQLAELRRKKVAAAAVDPPKPIAEAPDAGSSEDAARAAKVKEKFDGVMMPGQRKVSFLRVDSKTHFKRSQESEE